MSSAHFHVLLTSALIIANICPGESFASVAIFSHRIIKNAGLKLQKFPHLSIVVNVRDVHLRSFGEQFIIYIVMERSYFEEKSSLCV